MSKNKTHSKRTDLFQATHSSPKTTGSVCRIVWIPTKNGAAFSSFHPLPRPRLGSTTLEWLTQFLSLTWTDLVMCESKSHTPRGAWKSKHVNSKVSRNCLPSRCSHIVHKDLAGIIRSCRIFHPAAFHVVHQHSSALLSYNHCFHMKHTHWHRHTFHGCTRDTYQKHEDHQESRVVVNVTKVQAVRIAVANANHIDCKFDPAPSHGRNFVEPHGKDRLIVALSRQSAQIVSNNEWRAAGTVSQIPL